MIIADRRAFLRGAALVAGGAAVAGAGLSSTLAVGGRKLELYNGQHAQTTAALVEAFIKETGIQVEIRRGGSGQLANQMMEEGGVSPADVFFFEGSSAAAALANKGLLEPIDPETMQQVPARFSASDRTWLGITGRCRVVAYNKSMIRASELPPSVLDFGSEAWDGKVAYVPTSIEFLEQIIAVKMLVGRERTLDWLADLHAYGRVYNNNVAAMNAVERGEIATALINNYYWFSLAREVGYEKMRSALHYIRHRDAGALISVSAAGMLKSSRNRDEARAFLAFMVSAKGQQALADAVAEYPLRPGIVSPFPLEPFDRLDPPPVTPAEIGDAADAIAMEREVGLA
jgi:iron(III) transport system substrate-binding protein